MRLKYTTYVPEQYTLHTQEHPVPPANEEAEEKNLLMQKNLRILIGGGIILIIISFISGFLLRGLFMSSQPVPPPTTATSGPTPLATPKSQVPTPSNFSEIPASSIQFLPGKQYFEDTYAVVSKKQPYYTLILTVARIEQEKNYAQYTKINFFNGEQWDRKAITTTITNSTVVTNPLLRKWSTTPSNMQSDTVLADISLEGKTLAILSNNLTTEISVESLPGSTKFIYQGEGKIQIDGVEQDAYILRTRSYSFNAIDLAFFNSPENLTSNFVSFWDEEGDFYYVDTHSIKNPTSPIQTRTVGIKENTRGVVTKTERIIPSFQLTNGVNEFIVRIEDPIKEQLRITFFRTLDKAENAGYTWILANATGTSVKAEGRTVKGTGIVEYIRPQE